jgi:2-phosphosulfolactate phosphatase
MRIDVALVPAEARRWTNSVCIVLDQLRASSTIVALLDGGATAVVPAASLTEARRIARRLGPATLLVGEHRVVRAPGFDLGNSPAEVMAADVAGRVAVLSTRNGTAVLRALPAGTPILIGCLLNATAVARAAYERARASGADLGVVCAGRRGTFAIDDAIAAGCLLERVLAYAGLDDRELATADGRHDPRERGGPTVLTDAARAALQLWRSTPDLAGSFRASWSGHLLAAHDLLSDLDASLPVDASGVIPEVIDGDPPRIVRGGGPLAP